jgi:hypothetical protein
MICPHLFDAHHDHRGDGFGGYLPLGTMCEQTDGMVRCFDCGYAVPGGRYATAKYMRKQVIKVVRTVEEVATVTVWVPDTVTKREEQCALAAREATQLGLWKSRPLTVAMESVHTIETVVLP